MFFRRAPVKKITFEDHLNAARAAGFRVETSGGKARIERDGIACMAEDGGLDIDAKAVPRFTVRAGIVVGTEIATLTDGGYQKFFITPSGKKMPALRRTVSCHPEFPGRSAGSVRHDQSV